MIHLDTVCDCTMSGFESLPATDGAWWEGGTKAGTDRTKWVGCRTGLGPVVPMIKPRGWGWGEVYMRFFKNAFQKQNGLREDEKHGPEEECIPSGPPWMGRGRKRQDQAPLPEEGMGFLPHPQGLSWAQGPLGRVGWSGWQAEHIAHLQPPQARWDS